MRLRAILYYPEVITDQYKALFTRHKLTRVQPALKLTGVSFCLVNSANPGSTRVKSKALFTRHRLTRVRPGLKLTRVSFCRVNNANPVLIRVKSNPTPEVGSTWVEAGLV